MTECRKGQKVVRSSRNLSTRLVSIQLMQAVKVKPPATHCFWICTKLITVSQESKKKREAPEVLKICRGKTRPMKAEPREA